MEEKRAETPFGPGWFDPSAGAEAVANTNRLDMFRKALQAMGIAGLGAGALRVAQEIPDFASRTLGASTPPAVQRRSILRVPVPADDDDEEQMPAKRADDAGGIPGMIESGIRHGARALGIVRDPSITPSLGQQMWAPSPMRNPADQTWAWPVGILGTTAASLGGYSLVNRLLKNRKRDERKSELENARQEYEQALMAPIKSAEDGDGSGDPIDSGTKSDNEGTVGECDPIDALYEEMKKKTEKEAVALGNVGAGLYATLVGATGIGTGVAAYNYVKKHSQRKALEDAIRRRQEALYAAAPAIPVAVPWPTRREEPEAVPKAAGVVDAIHNARAALKKRQVAYAQQMQQQQGGKPPKPAPPAPAAPQGPPSLVAKVGK